MLSDLFRNITFGLCVDLDYIFRLYSKRVFEAMTEKNGRTHLYQNVDTRLHELIDENLRKAYQETVNEELPERFKVLISKLRSGEISDKPDGPSGGASE